MNITDEKKKEILSRFQEIKDFYLQEDSGTIVLVTDLKYYSKDVALITDELLEEFGVSSEDYGLMLVKE